MTEPVTLDRGRIRLAGLFVYLEHVVRPAGLLGPDEVPRAYGVAPTALSGNGTVLAAVAGDEAVWLGFQPTDPALTAVLVRIRVRVDGGEALDAVTGGSWNPELESAPRNHLLVPPDSRLVGIPRGGGIELFTAPMQLTVLVVDPPGAADIDLVVPAVFERLTGRRPPPLDRSRGYTGWRAP